MKKIRRIIATLFVALILIVKPINADVGSFDRYDSGSSSSSSSSSSSWSSSSSSSDWDWDSSSSSHRSGRSSSWDMGDVYALVGFFIIVAIVFIVNYFHNNNNNSDLIGKSDYTGKYEPGNGPVYTTEVRDVPISHIAAYKIQQVDPLFSEEKFLAWSKDLYVKMQQAWTARDWEPIRPYETEELFEQHSAQLQEFIRNKKINVVEQIAVNYATVYSFRQTDDKDIVEVALKATKKDYVIDEETKEVLQGNKNQDRITVYKMTFERTKGKQTQAGTEEIDAKNCPNCGAPLKFTSSGKCAYCGSIVSTGVYDWVLSNLEPLKY